MYYSVRIHSSGFVAVMCMCGVCVECVECVWSVCGVCVECVECVHVYVHTLGPQGKETMQCMCQI